VLVDMVAVDVVKVPVVQIVGVPQPERKRI
jgi:hypothetical protein